MIWWHLNFSVSNNRRRKFISLRSGCDNQQTQRNFQNLAVCLCLQHMSLKGQNENRQKAYNTQLTTTITKQLTCCCLEMSEINMMQFRKWHTAWHQIKRTLKEILAESTNNFFRKRHNKNHLPASCQFTSASVNLQLKSSRQNLNLQ